MRPAFPLPCGLETHALPGLRGPRLRPRGGSQDGPGPARPAQLRRDRGAADLAQLYTARFTGCTIQCTTRESAGHSRCTTRLLRLAPDPAPPLSDDWAWRERTEPGVPTTQGVDATGAETQTPRLHALDARTTQALRRTLPRGPCRCVRFTPTCRPRWPHAHAVARRLGARNDQLARDRASLTARWPSCPPPTGGSTRC